MKEANICFCYCLDFLIPCLLLTAQQQQRWVYRLLCCECSFMADICKTIPHWYFVVLWLLVLAVCSLYATSSVFWDIIPILNILTVSYLIVILFIHILNWNIAVAGPCRHILWIVIGCDLDCFFKSYFHIQDQIIEDVWCNWRQKAVPPLGKSWSWISGQGKD